MPRCAIDLKLREIWLISLRIPPGYDFQQEQVRRRLKNAGLAACRPKKSPLLTKKMMQKRLKFAKTYANWTTDMWFNVIWSDESKFNLFGSDGKQYVRRRKGEKYKKVCVMQAPKFPVSVMVWGCFVVDEMGKLEIIDGRVNAEKYIGILNRCLIPTIEENLTGNEDFIFQQDHAPCRTAKKVMQFIFFS